MTEKKVLFEFTHGLTDENKKVYYEDFVHIRVPATCEKESNNYLYSIWREMDENICMPHKEKCPWMYIPQRKVKNGKSYLFFGISDTSIGEIMWACSFEKKGVLNEIAFWPYYEKRRTDKNIQRISKIVENGIARVDELVTYTAVCKIYGNYEGTNYLFQEYAGEKYQIRSSDKYTELLIVGKGHYQFDFFNKMSIIIADLCDFLSMETNTLVNFDELMVYEGNRLGGIESLTMEFMPDDFIDFLPVNSNKKLLLQKEAISLIDILVGEKELESNLKNIFDSANVFREGLELEFLKESHTVAATDTRVKSIVKRNLKARVNMLSSAVALYMSALENLTVEGASAEQCESCGQLKYGITRRVGEIADKHFDSYMAKTMKKVYSMRSKYFHTANTFFKANNSFTLPELDEHAEVGCHVNGFISVMIDDESTLIAPNNIREWVSYIIRQELRERC